MTDEARQSRMSKRLRMAYHRTFGTEDGKIVLAHLARVNHIALSSHSPANSHETAFREGERWAVMQILHILGIRSDPDRLNNLMDQAETQGEREMA